MKGMHGLKVNSAGLEVLGIQDISGLCKDARFLRFHREKYFKIGLLENQFWTSIPFTLPSNIKYRPRERPCRRLIEKLVLFITMISQKMPRNSVF